MVTVSELVRSCLTKFTFLVASPALFEHAEEISLQLWKDEMGRLRIWSANIGAHQRGQSSLDFRLRDASHIKSQTINLLQGLEDLLNDLKEVLEEASDDESPENVEIPEDDDTTEIQQIHKDIVETIHHLYRMSMIIRTPAHHDRVLGTDKLDAQPFKHWAHKHASDKYPLADAVVLECVSSAMALQRAILKYRERHHAKLSQNLDDVKEGDRKSTILSETVATDMCRDLAPDLIEILSVADTAETQTSYAGTLIDGTEAKIPPLPKEGANKTPFECPYCFLIISVRDTRAWARHIFRDLMPYVCIFPGCSGKLYDSRRHWYGHVENAHADSMRAPRFDCSICKASLSSVMYERHVSRHLEELALFLLPRTAEGEEDSKQDTDENAAHASSDESSKKSHDDESPPKPFELFQWILDEAEPLSSISKSYSGDKEGPREIDHHRIPAPNKSYDGSEPGETEGRGVSPSNFEAVNDQISERDHETDLERTPLKPEVDINHTSPFEKFRRNDFLVMKHREMYHDLSFPENSIDSGMLTVGAVRMAAAEVLGATSEQSSLLLLHRGRMLKDNKTTCRAIGLNNGSQLSCFSEELPLNGPVIERLKEDPALSSSGGLDNPALSPNMKWFPTRLAQIAALTRWLQEEMVPLVNEYVANPPRNPEKREREYKRLSETILSQVLLKVDNIDTVGDQTVRMARRSLVKDAQAAIKQLDTISRLSFLEMLHVEDKTKTNEPKKKKHTSPVSSRRSSIESIVTPQDQVNDLSEHFLSMENAYEDGESGDNRSTMTTTTTERLNASLAFSEADICLDRLRKQYTNLCAELGNLSSSREKKTDDCFELIREITEQIDRVWEILSRYPAEIAEVLPRLQGLQGMKDQVLAALEIERFEGDQRNQ